MIAPRDGQVVDKLPLRNPPSRRVGSEVRFRAGALTQRSQARVIGDVDVWKRRQRRSVVWVLKDRRGVEYRTNEAVGHSGIEDMRVVELRLVLGLFALDVE